MGTSVKPTGVRYLSVKIMAMNIWGHLRKILSMKVNVFEMLCQNLTLRCIASCAPNA